MIHIVVPEGLNRISGPCQVLSSYYEECLRQVSYHGRDGDSVYLAPGNCFGHASPEDTLAGAYLRERKPALIVHSIDIPCPRYFDTLDNALLLRHWAEQRDLWPLPSCWLYCTRFHTLRAWLCFRVAGYRLNRIVASAPRERNRRIAPRLMYYDYPAAYVLYEALAIGYTALRLAKNLIGTGRFISRWSECNS